MLPYTPIIHEVRDFLEMTVSGFPIDNCGLASGFLLGVLNQSGYSGLNPVAGFHQATEVEQSMVHDTKRNYFIDISRDQFPGEYRPAIIEPDTSKIVVVDDDLTSKFIESLEKPFMTRQLSSLYSRFNHARRFNDL